MTDTPRIRVKAPSIKYDKGSAGWHVSVRAQNGLQMFWLRNTPPTRINAGTNRWLLKNIT